MNNLDKLDQLRGRLKRSVVANLTWKTCFKPTVIFII